MTSFLYKVSEPRDDWTLEPRRFWRADDWSFSDDRPSEGLVEDCVLYAAEFDEVNIHLLPRVWRLRVWLEDEARSARLSRLGFSWTEGSRAVIFAREADRHLIEVFTPTVFAFERSGFEQTPTSEFVSRETRTAISAEKITWPEARKRWRFEVIYVRDPEDLVRTLRSSGVDHQIQT